MEPWQHASEGGAEYTSALSLGKLQIARRAVALCFVLVLCATLVAGLWPFHSPVNEVTWTKSPSGIRFGRHGTAFSKSESGFPGAGAGPCSIEIFEQRSRTWTTGTLLAFYDSRASRQFTVEQDY